MAGMGEMRGECWGVETRIFGGMGVWDVGKGRRGKKRREAEGGKGKDDAR